MSVAEPEMIDGTIAATAASDGLSSSTVFLSLLMPALILYYIYFKVSRRHMLKLAEQLPGPAGLPLIGNMMMFLGSSDSKIVQKNTVIIVTNCANVLKKDDFTKSLDKHCHPEPIYII